MFEPMASVLSRTGHSRAATEQVRRIVGLHRVCVSSVARIGETPPVAPEPIDISMNSGAGEGIRTLDPNLGKVVLYP